MKKIIMAAAAVCLTMSATGCKETDTTPSEVRDAKVVSTITPDDSLGNVGGDVDDSIADGQTIEAVGEAVQPEETDKAEISAEDAAYPEKAKQNDEME